MDKDSTITDTDTAKVTDLIKIKIPSSELHRYTEQLQHALDPAVDLQELDTTNTEALSHPTGLSTTGEPDVVESGLTTTAALSGVAASGRVVMDYVKVPKVLNH